MSKATETTVTWRLKGDNEPRTARYYRATHDRHREHADHLNESMTDEDQARILEYRDACETGMAEILYGPHTTEVRDG